MSKIMHSLIESMMELRPRQENLRLVFRLFSLMPGLHNNLKMSLGFPCRVLNPIIDYFSRIIYKTERPFNASPFVQAIYIYFQLVLTC